MLKLNVCLVMLRCQHLSLCCTFLCAFVFFAQRTNIKSKNKPAEIGIETLEVFKISCGFWSISKISIADFHCSIWQKVWWEKCKYTHVSDTGPDADSMTSHHIPIPERHSSLMLHAHDELMLPSFTSAISLNFLSASHMKCSLLVWLGRPVVLLHHDLYVHLWTYLNGVHLKMEILYHKTDSTVPREHQPPLSLGRYRRFCLMAKGDTRSWYEKLRTSL